MAGKTKTPAKKAPVNLKRTGKPKLTQPVAESGRKAGSVKSSDPGIELLYNSATGLKAMTVLLDKHLYFCRRYVLRAGNCMQASRDAQMDYIGCQDLLREPLVIQEIQRYREERKAKFSIGEDRIVAELAKMAFGSLGDFMTILKDGTPVIDCGDIGAEELAALSEITQDTYFEKSEDGETDDDGRPIFDKVKKTKIKMHDKIAALNLLSKLIGMQDGSGLDKQTPEEKGAKIAAAIRKMIAADGV